MELEVEEGTDVDSPLLPRLSYLLLLFWVDVHMIAMVRAHCSGIQISGSRLCMCQLRVYLRISQCLVSTVTEQGLDSNYLAITAMRPEERKT